MTTVLVAADAAEEAALDAIHEHAQEFTAEVMRVTAGRLLSLANLIDGHMPPPPHEPDSVDTPIPYRLVNG